jgi:predicted GIY-YIG superfamily endonuclease
MTVYLIHFDQPYKHARHYLGYTESTVTLAARVKHHLAGRGSRLMDVVTRAGIKWSVVRTWPQADRNFERKLKNWKKTSRLCPVCRATRTS